MTTTPPDPHAARHDAAEDQENEACADAQNMRLRAENRALRELLAAHVRAAAPRTRWGWLRRMGWWLVAPLSAARQAWRVRFEHDDATPITRWSVGYAALAVLYTLIIYGALVLLIVAWSSPNS